MTPSSKLPPPADHSPSLDELEALASDAAEAAKKKAGNSPELKAAQDDQAVRETVKKAVEKTKQELGKIKTTDVGTILKKVDEAKSKLQPGKDEEKARPKEEQPRPKEEQPRADKPRPEKPKPEKEAPAKPAEAPQKAKPAKKPGLSPTGSDEPIKIVSDRLEADDKALTVIFQGNVKAVQGETTLWCDKMVVNYTKDTTATADASQVSGRKIKKIEVFGHVKVVKQDKTAMGQRGLYELEGRRVLLWGKAKLIQGSNVINGDKVILFMDDNRAVVEGGPRKVEAVLVPTKSGTK